MTLHTQLLRKRIKCRDDGGWFLRCWKIQEQQCGPVGLFIRHWNSQCCCTAVRVGWWRGRRWSSCRGFAIGRPERSQGWLQNLWRTGVGIFPGGVDSRSHGITSRTWVHLETAGNNSGTGGIPPHLWNLYQGGTEAGDEPDDDMVGSGRRKWTWVVDR